MDPSINGWNDASEELELLEALGTEVDLKGFLAGEVTPVFFGSALTNFGVRLLLDAVVDLAPSPASRYDVNNVPRPVEAPFSALPSRFRQTPIKLTETELPMFESVQALRTGNECHSKQD